jgi:triosephosphate isomerase
MRAPLIAGNWKMNGTADFSIELLNKIKATYGQVPAVEFAVFPPFVYLDICQKNLQDTSVVWGAQNVSNQPDGALTGEVSTAMLKDLGCTYVILGHSERRQIMGESSELVALKVQAALQAGLKPILCVGETLDERERGKTLHVVQEQLAHVLRLKDNLPALDSMVIAYEPIWAIGTGKTASPEQAEEVHAAIRLSCNEFVAELGEKMRVLYGGSVKPDNAASLFSMPNIDGALIGGASLKAEDFIEIGKQWNRS